MPNGTISYAVFCLKKKNKIGATAEAVKAQIALLIEQAFPDGVSGIQKQAAKEATEMMYKSQQAMKDAAAAAQRAAQYADLPDSPLYKDAISSKTAYENIARNFANEARQIGTNAKLDTTM